MPKPFQVQVTDFASGQQTTYKEYVPHPEVTLKVLPDIIDRLNVTVDNGRLSININGQLAFYDASLTDASIDIFK